MIDEKDYSWLEDHCYKMLKKPLSPTAVSEHLAVLDLIHEHKDRVQAIDIRELSSINSDSEHASDVLTVSFDSSVDDEAVVCVGRRVGDRLVILKSEHGAQADILHSALTDQNAKVAMQSEGAEQQIGHWIEHEWAEEVEGRLISNFECSCCHTWKRDESSYCPDCGARMVDPWADDIEREGN